MISSEQLFSKPLLINQLLIWEEEENIASITQKSFPGRIKCFRGILAVSYTHLTLPTNAHV